MAQKKRIGEKKTFWGLICGEQSKNILIPAIQRDYTYGSQTEITDKVLNNMLNTIKFTLFPDSHNGISEMTMNFVYGYTKEEVFYVPLDGQQRLTTLFLLHFYAALYDENGDFDTLRKFSYATRDTTSTYCKAIIDHHNEVLENYKSIKKLNDTIRDMSWYLPSFDNDPSIRSMQVVLGRIEENFKDCRESLWEKLTDDHCPVNFYCLNFGPFGLSDDLYVKMNSRGKKLTEYEIFKSMLLKHIDKVLNNKTKKRELAIKFDNSWTDLVWETLGKPNDEASLVRIDKAYIQLLKLLLRYLSYLHNTPESNPKLDVTSITKYMDTINNVENIEDILDVFYWANKKYGSVKCAINMVLDGITQIVKERDAFSNCLLGNRVTNGDFLFFVGIYWAFKQIQDNHNIDAVKMNLRHLRNIIENSDNEIRDENMPKLVNEVKEIVTSKMVPKTQVTFNTNQWNEECEKDKHQLEWQNLWDYEEHDLLRGSLSGFAVNQELDLSDSNKIKDLKRLLDNFSYVFDDNFHSRDHLIRAAFLTVADYSQYLRKDVDYRIIGNMPLCWRGMFIKNDIRHDQNTVISVIDSFNGRGPIEKELQTRIDNYLANSATEKSEWRYYAIKYREHTYKAYTHNDGYGYFFVNKNKIKTLEAIVLQSSAYGYSNVAWSLLPMILFERNIENYNMSLGTHAAREDEKNIYMHTSDGDFQLGISDEGWLISGLSRTDAERYGMKNINETVLDNQSYLLLVPDSNADFIEWAEMNILKPMEQINGFIKSS